MPLRIFFCLLRNSRAQRSAVAIKRPRRNVGRFPIAWRAESALCALLSLTAILCAQPPQPAQPARPRAQGPAARMAAQPVFNNNCASCHKNTKSSADEGLLKENNAPNTDTLSTMTPEAIYAALTTGAMVQQAAKLSDDDKRLVAEFFGGR